MGSLTSKTKYNPNPIAKKYREGTLKSVSDRAVKRPETELEIGKYCVLNIFGFDMVLYVWKNGPGNVPIWH
jgi:hypothetical protein